MQTTSIHTHQNHHSQDLLLIHVPTTLQQITAMLFLAAVLAIFRLQILLRFNTHFLGGYEGDAGFYIWLVKSNLNHLFSEPWFNTKAFYPYTRTLAWSDNYILPSFAVWPLLKIGFRLESSYNLVLLLANFLNGFITFRLAFALLGSFTSAFFAGSLFMCFSYLGLQLGHPQLPFAFWLPTTFYFLFKFLHKPTWHTAINLGFSIFLCFLCSVYYAVFISLSVFLLLTALILLKPAALPMKAGAVLICGGGLGLSPIWFFLQPYLDVRNAFGPRTLNEIKSFSATALSYLSAPIYNLLYRSTSAWSHAEANLFPGVVILVLGAVCVHYLANTRRLLFPMLLALLFFAAACGLSLPAPSSALYRQYATAFCLWGAIGAFSWLLLKLGRLERKLGFYIVTNRNLGALFLFLALVTFALSLGPLGETESGRFAPGVYTPFYYLVPGLNAMRAISRIGIVAVFGLIMAAAFALEFFKYRVGLRLWFPMACTLIGLIENFNPIYPVQPGEAPSGAFNTLASAGFCNTFKVDRNDTLLVLPLAGELKPDRTVKSWSRFAIQNVNYMNWGVANALSLVNGYSGQRTWFTDNLPGRLVNFPDGTSMKALAAIAGLRFIIYVPRYDTTRSAAEIIERSVAFSSELNHLITDEQGNLLFEYSPLTKISEDYRLFAPSFPGGVLKLELMTLYQEGSPNFKMPVLVKDRLIKRLTYALEMVADGEWKSYSVRTPKKTNRCHPISISFSPPKNASIYLRRRHFEPLP